MFVGGTVKHGGKVGCHISCLSTMSIRVGHHVQDSWKGKVGNDILYLWGWKVVHDGDKSLSAVSCLWGGKDI